MPNNPIHFKCIVKVKGAGVKKATVLRIPFIWPSGKGKCIARLKKQNQSLPGAGEELILNGQHKGNDGVEGTPVFCFWWLLFNCVPLSDS